MSRNYRNRADAVWIWRGAWSNTTVYELDNFVSYNGEAYICLAAHTNQQPDIAPLYWDLFIDASVLPANIFYNVLDFGVLGDGVTNNHTTLQAAVDYVKTNGGRLYFPTGVYATNTTVDIGSNTHSFVLCGDGESSVIKNTSTGTVLNGGNIIGMRIMDLNIYAGGVSSNHGISIYDSTFVFIERCYVTNFLNTGILIYIANEANFGQFGNTQVLNCLVDGLTIANNGINLVSLVNSRIDNCAAGNLSLTGSPAYGLQLKNLCQSCTISNSYAWLCKGGVAFGNDNGTGVLACQFNYVVNCEAFNCLQGIVMGQACNNIVRGVNIDMASTNNEPIRMLAGSSLALSCFGNTITGISTQNTQAAKNIVRMDAFCNNNYVEIENVRESGHNAVALFAASTAYNLVKLCKRTDTGGVALNTLFTNSGDATNVFQYWNSSTINSASYLIRFANGIGTEQTITKSTATTLTNSIWGGSTVSLGTDITYASGVMTIVTAGLYMLSASVAWDSSTFTVLPADFFMGFNCAGGTTITVGGQGIYLTTVTTDYTQTTSILHKFAAGDTVRVNVYQTQGVGGSTCKVYGLATDSFSAYRLA